VPAKLRAFKPWTIDQAMNQKERALQLRDGLQHGFAAGAPSSPMDTPTPDMAMFPD
jgi:hypothetical protein